MGTGRQVMTVTLFVGLAPLRLDELSAVVEVDVAAEVVDEEAPALL